MKSLIVLPSYNERENITQLMQAILDINPDFCVCVVDDNSPDGTVQEIRQFADRLAPADKARVHLIVRTHKDGRGGAVREGLKWGLASEQGFAHFVEMDCDFSHPPADIVRGIDLLQARDVVMGSRYPDGKIIGWPLRRKIFSYLANLMARALIRWDIADYTNGYRFYSRRAAEFICSLPQRHTGYIYLSETISAFLRAGFRIGSFPIVFVNRERGVSNTGLAEIKAALRGIVAIAWNHRFGGRSALEAQR